MRVGINREQNAYLFAEYANIKILHIPRFVPCLYALHIRYFKMEIVLHLQDVGVLYVMLLFLHE